LREEKGVYPWH